MLSSIASRASLRRCREFQDLSGFEPIQHCELSSMAEWPTWFEGHLETGQHAWRWSNS
jgi:hypothetical protein